MDRDEGLSGAHEGTSDDSAFPEGYELLRPLGRGGCGVVYEAKHPLHGVVALKLTDTRGRVGGSVAARLSREGEILTRVSHENVLRVFDVGRTPAGSPYLVMEILHGEDIESVLHRFGSLSIPFACEVLRQVLNALEAVHGVGIIHRDLKPNNVMIDVPSNGERPVVKLIDFGIAKDGGGERLTKTGSLVGTPQYLAPEQVRGASCDERVDVWAAGILLFELLAGCTPFDGLGLEETFSATLYADVPNVRSHRPEVPAPIATLIAHALERKPEDRPPSARSMRETLEAAIAECGIAIDAESLRTLPFIRKRTLPFGLGGLDLQRLVRTPESSDSLPTSEAELVRRSLETPISLEGQMRVAGAALSTPPLPSRRHTHLAIAALSVVAVACVVARFVLVGPADASANDARVGSRTLAGAPVRSPAPPTPSCDAVPSCAPAPAPSPSTARPVVASPRAAMRERVAHTTRPPEVRATSSTPVVPSLVARARAAYANGRLEEANQLYDRAKDAMPTYAPAWRGYGITSLELGHGLAARRAMRRYRSLISDRAP